MRTHALIGLATYAMAFAAFSADKTVLSVKPVSKAPPSEMSMQKEDDMARFVFKVEADGAYKLELPLPTANSLAALNKLAIPYRFVATWADGKEQFFMQLHSRLPNNVELKVYRPQVLTGERALQEIDVLGTDFESVLEKYCRARAFHLSYRQKSLPYHYLALRSARIWFDASANLAKRRDSFFRMDEEVQKFMNDYESRASSDSNFRRLLRQYASSGYVEALLQEVKAADYAFVGVIPKLVDEKRFEEAYDLNAKALKALGAESTSVQKMVVKQQGINVDLLQKNDAFLATRRLPSG